MSSKALVGSLFSLFMLVAIVGCAGSSASPATSTASRPPVSEPTVTKPAVSTPAVSEPSAPKPTVSKTPVSKPTATRPPSPTPQKQQGLAGVWMGLINQYTTTGRYTPRIQFLTMYEDGSFYYSLPLEGLEGFDRNKSRNDEKEYWGTYTFNGASGTWKRAAYDPREMKLDKNGGLQIGADPFYRCEPVDGLRLDGAWTTDADPKNPDLSRGEVQPVMRFAADGKFQDEGLFEKGGFLLPDAAGGQSVDEQAVAPGKGTYEITNYTLTLKYDDGRVRRAAFNLYFGTEQQPSPEAIFIYRVHLQRM